MKHQPAPLSFTLWLAMCMLWCGCSRNAETEECSDAIYSSGDIEVFSDSIIIGNVNYTAISPYEITNCWKSTSDTPDPHITLTSSSLMADALFNKAISTCHHSSPSVTDIYLHGALLDPQRSMEALRSMVDTDGTIHRQGFPIKADKEAWAAAAWEIYCATGSASWLKESYRIINRTLQKEHFTIKADPDGLIHGTPSYMEPPQNYFPSWMSPVDRFHTICLGTNLWHYATLSVACKMARKLKLYAEREWAAAADRIRNAINDNFWIPSASMYGQYMYGNLYPVLSSSADNRANSLSVILSVASPEMGRRLMESRPTRSYGMPAVSPSINDAAAEPAPDIQVLQGIAAAHTQDEEALLEAIGPLWCMGLDERADAGWHSLLLRGLLGIRLYPDGLSLSPFIPGKLPGEKRLCGLRFREAILDINIHGSGNKIASFSIDSVSQERAFIDQSISAGPHRIDIVMSGNSLSDMQHTIATSAPDTPPASPKIFWNDDRHGKILNYDKDAVYDVYTNGILSESITAPHYAVTDTGTTVIDIVPKINNISGFAARSHISAPASSRIHIPATAITPRRAPLHLIRNKDIATHYIELAARHNTRITFYVQAPSEGEYFINIGYSNGTAETALRTLEVNEKYAGTLIFPPVAHNDWISVRTSSTVTATLRAGANKLSLTYAGTTILLNEINLLKK
ncbi:hypothetical protein [uncultured Duncaniella sp.]|uniref:alpha-L-rhamnosidase-related protein n=1 Tax=uncultured Duncaniella sp. TaxID=2768039 RepID=UPI0025A99B91|nr:hypothetical protein [uncultured Duncaniella sp.]